VSIKCPGSVNDNLAFSVSGMYRWLAADGLASLTREVAFSRFGLPNGFWLAGDNAYTCSDSLVVPFPGTDLSPDCDALNFYQVSVVCCCVSIAL